MIEIGNYVRIKDEYKYQQWHTANVYVVVYAQNTYYGRVLGLDNTFTHNFLEKPYNIETDTEINEHFLELDIKEVRAKKLKELF